MTIMKIDSEIGLATMIMMVMVMEMISDDGDIIRIAGLMVMTMAKMLISIAGWGVVPRMAPPPLPRGFNVRG